MTTQEQEDTVRRYLDSCPGRSRLITLAILSDPGVGKRKVVARVSCYVSSRHDIQLIRLQMLFKYYFDEIDPTWCPSSRQQLQIFDGQDISLECDEAPPSDRMPPNSTPEDDERWMVESLRHAFNAEVTLVLFDVARMCTFQRAMYFFYRWPEFSLRRAKEFQTARPKENFYIVASRADIPRAEWQVPLQQAENFCKRASIPLLQMSAKSGLGLEDADVARILTQVLYRRILNERTAEEDAKNENVEEQDRSAQKSANVFASAFRWLSRFTKRFRFRPSSKQAAMTSPSPKSSEVLTYDEFIKQNYAPVSETPPRLAIHTMSKLEELAPGYRGKSGHSATSSRSCSSDLTFSSLKEDTLTGTKV